MKPNIIYSLIALATTCVLGTAVAADKAPLKLNLPNPGLTGTPVPIKGVPNLDLPPKSARPDILVPVGTENLSKGKKVTSSDPEPINGTLDLVTDGDKAADEGSWVELAPGKQWVQIDLEKSATIAAIVIWHFHSEERAYRGVVVQISDDPEFKTGITNVFNNDYANTVGVGVGKDHPYVENYQGKLVEVTNVKGRYVRLYSAGNTTNKRNHYIEVEVFGKPAA
jgi:hypothetical protein